VTLVPADRPLWRRAFDAVDGRVGRSVEDVVRSDVFADAVSTALRLQRRAHREAERQTRRVLHTFNVPAATDVKRLSQQLAALQREVRALERRDHED
jgi:polyhydroxyalkanoate synthesis regulator phasin